MVFARYRLKTQLAAAFLVLMGAALAVLLLYVIPHLRHETVHRVERAQQTTARQLAHGLTASFDLAVREMQAMARLPALRRLDPTAIDRLLETFNAANQFFDYFFVMDPTGRWLSYPSRDELVGCRIPAENMTWVETTIQSAAPVFLDVVRSRVGTLVSGIAVRIENPHGDPVGLLRGVIVVSEQNVLVTSLREVAVGSRGLAFLVASDGRLLAHPQQSPRFTDPASAGFRPLEPVRRAIAGHAGVVHYDDRGETWVAAFQPVGIAGWAVVVQQPLADVLAAANHQTFLILATFTLTFLLAGIFAVLTLQFALRPLSELLQRIRRGEPTGRADYPRNEIGDIARQYDALYAELYRSRSDVQRSEEKFRTLFDGASDAIFIHDLDGRFLEVNRAACERLGYSRDRLLEMDIAAINPPERGHLIEDRLVSIRQKGALLFEGEQVTRDGRPIPVEGHVRIIDFDQRQAALSIARDITERRDTERALRESEERFRRLMEDLPLGVVLVDTTGEPAYVNPGFAKIFGYGAAEISSNEGWFRLAQVRQNFPGRPHFRAILANRCRPTH